MVVATGDMVVAIKATAAVATGAMVAEIKAMVNINAKFDITRKAAFKAAFLVYNIVYRASSFTFTAVNTIKIHNTLIINAFNI